MAVVPPTNLDPNAAPWGRWVTEQLKEVAQGTKRAAQGVSNVTATSNVLVNGQGALTEELTLTNEQVEVAKLAAEQALIEGLAAADEAQEAADAANFTAIAAKAAAAAAEGQAAAAVKTAGEAQTSADGKNRIWYQSTAPVGTAHKAGDTWFNTADGNKISTWSGSAWVLQSLGGAALGPGAVTAENIAQTVNDKIAQGVSDSAAAVVTAGAAQTKANTAAADAAAAQIVANSKSRNWPTSVVAPTTGMSANDTWIRSTDGALFRYSGSTWVAVPLATQSYVQSRGLNLVTNGSGLLGDNTNFEGLTFDASDHPVGAASMFTGSNQVSTFTTENIPVDPALTYEMSATVKQLEGTANFYFAIAPIDADGSAITPQMYTYLPGSFTTLAQPLAQGDTTITLTSSANWHTGSTAAQKYAAIGNYTDGKGYTWPVGTYTRTFPQFSSISGNVVTLAAPYTSRPAPAGTPVWNSFAAGTYLYPVTNVPAPAEWTTFSGRFAGITTPGASSVNSLPRPTAFVKLGFLMNYPPRTGAPRQGFANISLNEITVAAAAQQAANVAQTTANGKNTVTYGTAAPTAVGTRAGDIFFVRVAATGVITAQYEWTGAAWQIRTLDNATIANLDAGKLTAGTISADRIGANSITASKLTLGDFSNLLDDPTFTNPLGRSWIISSGPVSLASSTSAPGRVIVLAANGGTVRVDNGNQIAVTPGSSYYMAFRAVNSTGAQAVVVLTGRNEAGTGVWSQAIGIPANSGWSDYTFTTAAAPDTVAYMTFSASIAAASTSGSFQFAKPSVRRRNGGELIVDGGITAQQMAANTITAGSAIIADAAITGAKIADAAITNAKIANLDAAKITSGFIDASRIEANSITTAKIAAGAVTALEIGAGAITAGKLAANAVLAENITADAILAVSIKAGAVTAGKLSAGSVAADNIQSNAVTADKITANAVTADKIMANAVTANAISGNAIDGMTITGALVRTAATGARTEMTNQGIRVLDGSGVEQVRLGYGSPTGMAVRDVKTNTLVPLSNVVFGTVSATLTDSVFVGNGATGGVWSAGANVGSGVGILTPTGRCIVMTTIDQGGNYQDYSYRFWWRITRSSAPNTSIGDIYAGTFGGTNAVTVTSQITTIANESLNLYLFCQATQQFGATTNSAVGRRTTTVIPI